MIRFLKAILTDSGMSIMLKQDDRYVKVSNYTSDGEPIEKITISEKLSGSGEK